MFYHLDSCEFLQKLGQHIIPVAPHIKVRVKTDQTASYFTESGWLIDILILNDHLNDRIFNLLFTSSVMCCLALRCSRILLTHQIFQNRKLITRFPEWLRSLIFSHANNHLSALSKTADESCKVAVTGYNAKSIHIIRVQDIHRINDHS